MNDDARRGPVSAEEIERLEGLVDGSLGAMAFPLLAEAHRRAGRPEEAERVARAGLRSSSPVTAGRIALALALLDQKRTEDARAELEGLLGGEAEHAIAGDAAAAMLAAASESAPLVPIEPISPIEPVSAGPFGPAPPEPIEAADSPAASLEPLDAAGPFGPPPPPARAEALVFGGVVGDDELEGAFDEAESDREQMLGADDVAQAALAQVPDDDELEEAGGVLVDSAADPSSPFATETVAGLLERQGHGDEADRVRETLSPEPAPLARIELVQQAPPVEPLPIGAAPEPEPIEAHPDPMPPEPDPFDAAPVPMGAEPDPFDAAPVPMGAEPDPFDAAPVPMGAEPDPFDAAPIPMATEPDRFDVAPAPAPPEPDPFADAPAPIAAEPAPVSVPVEPVPTAPTPVAVEPPLGSAPEPETDPDRQRQPVEADASDPLAGVEPEPAPAARAPGANRQRTQATLERWLDNLRRDRP